MIKRAGKEHHEGPRSVERKSAFRRGKDRFQGTGWVSRSSGVLVVAAGETQVASKHLPVRFQVWPPGSFLDKAQTTGSHVASRV